MIPISSTNSKRPKNVSDPHKNIFGIEESKTELSTPDDLDTITRPFTHDSGTSEEENDIAGSFSRESPRR